MLTLLLDELDDEYEYYGLQFQAYPEYKLIYKINTLINTHFHRITDLDINTQDQIFCHSVYCHDDSCGENTTYLIKNQSHEVSMNIENALFSALKTSQYLLKKYNNYDYILKLNINLTLPHDIPLSLQSVGISILVDKLDLKESEKKLLYL